MLLMDHLPECPAGYVADLCTTDIDPVLQEPSCNHCVGQGCICICNRLRACEQRVLDAAREAVAALTAGPQSGAPIPSRSMPELQRCPHRRAAPS